MKIKNEKEQNTIMLPTASWYGSRNRNHLYKNKKFWFPKNWQIELFEPAGLADAHILDENKIRQQIENPIGAEPLRKLAENKKSAAIIVDDMTRPTPAYAVLPAILKALEAGGIKRDKIRIVVGMGLHRPIKRFEQRRKVGPKVVERYIIENHNAFTRKTKRYRRPDGKPDIVINRTVGEADLKISISGIIPQGGAGFGGGAKAILPAVSTYRTVLDNHDTYAWEEPGLIYPEKIESNCIRKDMEEVARIVGLDFSVNLVFTPYKEVIGLPCGDFVKAHRAGCVLAREIYLTPLPKEKLDLVVTNGYPLDTEIGQAARGSWPEKYGKVSVLLGRAGDGWSFHSDGGISYRTFQRMKRQGLLTEEYRFKGVDEIEGVERYFYSDFLGESVFYERSSDMTFCGDWDQLMGDLSQRFDKATVGVFPYASLQLEKSEFVGKKK